MHTLIIVQLPSLNTLSTELAALPVAEARGLALRLSLRYAFVNRSFA